MYMKPSGPGMTIVVPWVENWPHMMSPSAPSSTTCSGPVMVPVTWSYGHRDTRPVTLQPITSAMGRSMYPKSVHWSPHGAVSFMYAAQMKPP
jgi:hypothetical protein